MKKLKRIVTLILITLFITSCGSSVKQGGNDYKTNFRFINAISDSDAVDLYLDSGLYQSNVGFLESTGYAEESTGSHDFQVNDNASSGRLVTLSGSLGDKTDQTLVVFGSKTLPVYTLLKDDNSKPSSDTAFIRVIQAASNYSSLDIYILTPSSNINTVGPTVKKISYKQSSSYIAVPKGDVTISITSGNSKSIITAKTASLDGESVYSVLVSDSAGVSTPAKVTLIKDS